MTSKEWYLLYSIRTIERLRSRMVSGGFPDQVLFVEKEKQAGKKDQRQIGDGDKPRHMKMK